MPGRVRGANVSKSKNWFPICNNTHHSPAFDVFSPKGGRGKRERSFSPLALSPPRLTSLFFFPQKRLILRIERQSQKRSGEEKGTISATIPPTTTTTTYGLRALSKVCMGRNGQGKNHVLDQILLYEPFFTHLAWEWLKRRFPALRT